MTAYLTVSGGGAVTSTMSAERKRWTAVEKAYHFEGPEGKVSLLGLFEGRRRLIVYRAFFEPGVFGWPELGADRVAHLARLNARDTTLAYASRASQEDIVRLKARMGWKIPWYTITDSFDADFGVDQWHGHNVFARDGERVFRTYFIDWRGDEAIVDRPLPGRPSGGLLDPFALTESRPMDPVVGYLEFYRNPPG
ncbi:MAG TPA: DUF899 family protein [Steroidobacteraceae bacterium]|nr:DUF899 family protein [Steroidobacteraceae bacterium]